MNGLQLYNGCLRKKRYFGYKQAMRVARKCMKEHKNCGQLYVYACPYCENYHITSHPKTANAVIVHPA